MTADLQGTKFRKPDVKYSFQQGLLLLAHTAFSRSRVTSASSLPLFPCPLRIRHRNPHSLQREKGQSGLTLSWQTFAGPWSQPGLQPSPALEEGKESVGERKKYHSAEKEFGVKRTGERGGRRDRRVK